MKLYIIIISLFLASCFTNFPPDFIEFKKLSKPSQEEKFKSLPLEKQVDYYLFCWAAKDCDKFYFEVLASQGKSALPYLLKRMEVGSESEKYELSVILAKMNNEYVKIDDKESIFKLKTIINNMKDPYWKEMTEENVSNIINKNEK